MQQLAKLEGCDERQMCDKRRQLDDRWGLPADKRWCCDRKRWLDERWRCQQMGGDAKQERLYERQSQQTKLEGRDEKRMRNKR
jgi:hypothetical protein